MFQFTRKFFRRSKGMEALQSVILLVVALIIGLAIKELGNVASKTSSDGVGKVSKGGVGGMAGILGE